MFLKEGAKMFLIRMKKEQQSYSTYLPHNLKHFAYCFSSFLNSFKKFNTNLNNFKIH